VESAGDAGPDEAAAMHPLISTAFTSLTTAAAAEPALGEDRPGPGPEAGEVADGARPGPAPLRLATDVAPAAAVGALSLAVYVRTLLPGVGYSGDTAKWQFLGEVGGTPHPTGYPLYLLINKAFVTVVPLGSLAWRANVLSAVLGAATAAVLVLVLRTLGARPGVAAATAAATALTLGIWSQAVVAEVYTLHLLLLAAVTLCLARWAAGGSDRWLLAGLALLAASFGNHLGTALSLPGVAWVLWVHRRRALTPRNLAWAAAAAALGAAQYLYLVRMTAVGAYVEQPVHGLDGIVEAVSGGRFRDQMFTFSPAELITDRLPLTLRLAWHQFGPLLAVTAWGVTRAWRGVHRAIAVHLLALAAASSVYAMNFDVPDVFVFYLPAWLALAVFTGLGLEDVAGRVAPRLSADRTRRAAGAVALAAVPAALLVANYHQASQRGSTADAERIERLIEAAGHDAVLVTDNYADSEYVWYYLLGERMGAERHLTLASQVTPAQVRGLVEPPAVGNRFTATPPVYTATPHQADELRAAGLSVTEVDDGVWSVRPAGR
jgi:hypothetical protein